MFGEIECLMQCSRNFTVLCNSSNARVYTIPKNEFYRRIIE
jgi:hypothetical protein